MMKKIVACLFACVLLNTLNAQSFQFSPPVKSKISLEQVQILGTDSKGFYSTENNVKEQRLQLTRYATAGMQPEWSKSIAYGAGDSDMRLEQIVFASGKFYLFSGTFHQESEQMRIYCTIIDHTGNILNEQILVHYVLSEGRSGASTFGVEISPDEKHILIYFNPPLGRKLTETLSFRCYDTDLDIIWEKEILLPYGSNIVQVHQFVLDNETNLYLLSGKEKASGFDKINKPESGRYVLFFYNPKEHKLKEYDVTLKDKQIASCIMRFDHLQNIIIGGYYSLDYKMNISGTYYYNITSKGGPVIAASFMPFKEDLTSRYKEEDAKNIMPDYHLIDILPVEGGNTILIGERRYITEEVQYNQMTNVNTTETRFNFGDILITKAEANGRHIWNTVIPKYQYSTSGITHQSFDYFKQAGSVELFYNDNKENIEKLKLDPKAQPSSWSGNQNSITTRVVLNASGTTTFEPFLSNKDNGSLLNNGIINHTNREQVVLGYSNNDQYRLCRIK